MDAMFDGEMRLFLEELCCELCRFRHAADNGIDPDEVNIAREVRLAPLGAFADIVVTLPAAPAYFVERHTQHSSQIFCKPSDYLQSPSCRRSQPRCRSVADAAARLRVLLA